MSEDNGRQIPVIQSDLRTVYCGCALSVLSHLETESGQMCVTSPPYWGLRDYKHKGQWGSEKTIEEHLARMVACFSEVRRILKRDGTLWMNYGDCYMQTQPRSRHGENGPKRQMQNGLKKKDLVGMGWRVAFALQADGWYLRSDIIWAKPNPMPESITDRPTRSHEFIFLFSKSPKYYYDAQAIRETPSPTLIQQIEEGYNGHAIKDYLGSSVQDASATKSRIINGYRNRIDKQRGHSRRHAGFNGKWDALTPAEQAMCGRNKRDVWTVAPANFKEAHFATFPPKLIEPCILAGSKPGDTVLDPFAGSGTTGEVAIKHGRKALLVELNPEYIPMIDRRTSLQVQPQLVML